MRSDLKVFILVFMDDQFIEVLPVEWVFYKKYYIRSPKLLKIYI